jgi:hypothetical protein
VGAEPEVCGSSIELKMTVGELAVALEAILYPSMRRLRQFKPQNPHFSKPRNTRIPKTSSPSNPQNHVILNTSKLRHPRFLKTPSSPDPQNHVIPDSDRGSIQAPANAFSIGRQTFNFRRHFGVCLCPPTPDVKHPTYLIHSR